MENIISIKKAKELRSDLIVKKNTDMIKINYALGNLINSGGIPIPGTESAVETLKLVRNSLEKELNG